MSIPRGDDRSVQAYHDLWARMYDSDYERKAGLYHAVTLARLRQFLSTPRPGSVLDVGGGTGIWSDVLLRLGCPRVTLLDASPGMLECARRRLCIAIKKGCVEVITGDVTHMDMIENDAFSLILAQGDVLSYCGSAEAGLQEIARVAKGGALVIVSVDGRIGRAQELLDVGDLEGARSAIHLGIAPMGNPSLSRQFSSRSFDPNELRQLVEGAGLQVVSLVGKCMLRVSVSVAQIATPAYSWLVDFELERGGDPLYLRRSRWLEVVACKPARGRESSDSGF